MQRARVLAYMLEDTNLYASEAGLKAGFTSTVTTPVWVHRFNEKELAGLEDQPRKGRKPTHGAEVHSQLVSLATQKPKTLGYPFELWTLERLQTAFLERHGIHLSDSTIWEWLAAEGLEWKLQQSWFHAAEKHDPEFVEKKGSIIAAYMTCVPRTRVICVDEMGPIAVKTYPGEAWLMGPNRATFEPAYGRRGKLWVRGGFEPATGQAAILMSPGRDSTSHIQLLEKIFVQFPADRWLNIEDNLSIHISW